MRPMMVVMVWLCEVVEEANGGCGVVVEEVIVV